LGRAWAIAGGGHPIIVLLQGCCQVSPSLSLWGHQQNMIGHGRCRPSRSDRFIVIGGQLSVVSGKQVIDLLIFSIHQKPRDKVHQV
jgi:hypothetical protein